MGMYDSDYYKDCKDEQKKERKEKEFCVQLNIFCDDDKKEIKSKDDKYREDKCKEDYKKEPEQKEEDFCVQVNIFCDKCKKEYLQ